MNVGKGKGKSQGKKSSELTTDQRREVQNVFDTFDSHNSGEISLKDLKVKRNLTKLLVIDANFYLIGSYESPGF